MGGFARIEVARKLFLTKLLWHHGSHETTGFRDKSLVSFS